MGEFMAVDVGGATTDVYSMAHGAPKGSDVLEKGLPEPFAKRSVEGDLGLRYSMPSLMETAGSERIAGEIGISESDLKAWAALCRREPGVISKKGGPEKAIDEKLCSLAVEIAVERHCGALESVYTPFGESFMQSGKDLRKINALIGIGGPVINSENPAKALKSAFYTTKAPLLLKPENPRLYIDKKYIFASMGLVGKLNPGLALTLMKREIIEI
jgi:uncharacterized protein (TIGR01319 family)